MAFYIESKMKDYDSVKVYKPGKIKHVLQLNKWQPIRDDTRNGCSFWKMREGTYCSAVLLKRSPSCLKAGLCEGQNGRRH